MNDMTVGTQTRNIIDGECGLCVNCNTDWKVEKLFHVDLGSPLYMSIFEEIQGAMFFHKN